MNIKDFIIKKIGGYTENEYRNKNCIAAEVHSNSYYIDDDALEVEKEQLAYKLGKELLDNDLIHYEITNKRDNIYSKIYTISAQVFVSNRSSK